MCIIGELHPIRPEGSICMKHYAGPRSQSDQADLDKRSIQTQTIPVGPSMTVQGQAAEADINNIVKAFGVDRIPLPPEVSDPNYYGDLSDVPDLRTALEQVREAQDRFMALPARLRSRFDNSPGKLWEFLHDPENMREAVTLGLLVSEASSPIPAPTEPIQAAP